MRSFLSMARLSWSVQALLGCGAFLVVGIVVVDDYGVGWDAQDERVTVQRNLAFIVGDTGRLDGFSHKFNKYYGVAFELPLLLLERGLGLEDSRSIYLVWHLVTHAFFLVGGLYCSLLVYRLTHSRTVALFAFLLFVLQPRLYAHSFFNSKDLPFLSMFMVTLYVTHRAFRRDTVGAFVLCGVCVGILTNLRIMGVMLYPMVLALRGLDLGQAGRGERTYVLATGTVFAVTGPCTLYALSPYLWTNPFEFVPAWHALSYHPMRPLDMLFQGQVVDPHQPPWHYIPTWMAISTPLVTLLCCGLGVIGVCLRSVLHPRTASANTDLRFGLLLVACPTLSVLAIILLGSHICDEWRQVFFLHAPLCGLAGLGMHWAGGGRSRAAAGGVYALAGLGVGVTGVEMVQLHPHQQVYFNELVDRTTPEYLHDHYVLDAWRNSCREGLEFLRRRYPATTVYVRNSRPVYLGWENLPSADRARLGLVLPDDGPDFAILCGRDLQNATENLSVENTVYTRKVYNNTLLTVTAQVTVPDAALKMARRFYDDGYQKITSGRLVQRAMFDIYTYPGDRILGYAKDKCTASDIQARFFVHVFPVNEQELPARRRRYGFDNRDFNFFDWGKQEAGRCWTTVALPAYAIMRIRTGQYNEREKIWETDLVEPIYTPLTMR